MLFLCNVIIKNFKKIIGIKVCYYIFLHNKIHLKINSIIYKDTHVQGDYRGDCKLLQNNDRYNDYLHIISINNNYLLYT